jgi:hypothetical protein
VAVSNSGNIICAVEKITLGARHDARVTGGGNKAALLLIKYGDIWPLVLKVGVNEFFVELGNLILSSFLSEEGLRWSEEEGT